ncbi:MAG: hypothetical protein LUQ25_08495 [Methanoregulaceae archaeon]|nr:hypothetical protein [Methanoregulaceae archaeon]
MSGRRLFVFVEGSDDERFFARIIRPRLQAKYSSVELITYACMKSAKVSKFVKGIRSMNHEYILVADIDREKSVQDKKLVLLSRFDEIDENRIVVIIKEIESWYLAGLDEKAAHHLGLRYLGHTDFVTKEHFNSWIPRGYTSRISFMIECLRYFSISEAVTKNRSFRFFMGRYILEKERPDVAAANQESPGSEKVQKKYNPSQDT